MIFSKWISGLIIFAIIFIGCEKKVVEKGPVTKTIPREFRIGENGLVRFPQNWNVSFQSIEKSFSSFELDSNFLDSIFNADSIHSWFGDFKAKVSIHEMRLSDGNEIENYINNEKIRGLDDTTGEAVFSGIKAKWKHRSHDDNEIRNYVFAKDGYMYILTILTEGVYSDFDLHEKLLSQVHFSTLKRSEGDSLQHHDSTHF